MAKTFIFSLLVSAVAVDLNAGFPKPPASIDAAKYITTVADGREVALHQRHMSQTCSYPNNKTFDCADIHGDIKVSTLQCLVCDRVPGQCWPEEAHAEICWVANFCANDGSSHVQAFYKDEACQDNLEEYTIVVNTTAGNTNRNCYTGMSTSDGCSHDLDILHMFDGWICKQGQCSASHPAPLCNSDGYCDQPDYCGYPGQPCDTSCCTQVPVSGEVVAAYEWWYEFRSSSYVCDEKVGQCVEASEGGQPREDCEGSCKESQYACKNNQCVAVASGGGNYRDCLKFCDPTIV